MSKEEERSILNLQEDYLATESLQDTGDDGASPGGNGDDGISIGNMEEESSKPSSTQLYRIPDRRRVSSLLTPSLPLRNPGKEITLPDDLDFSVSEVASWVNMGDDARRGTEDDCLAIGNAEESLQGVSSEPTTGIHWYQASSKCFYEIPTRRGVSSSMTPAEWWRAAPDTGSNRRSADRWQDAGRRSLVQDDHQVSSWSPSWDTWSQIVKGIDLNKSDVQGQGQSLFSDDLFDKWGFRQESHSSGSPGYSTTPDVQEEIVLDGIQKRTINSSEAEYELSKNEMDGICMHDEDSYIAGSCALLVQGEIMDDQKNKDDLMAGELGEVVEQEEKFQPSESSNACGNDAPKVTSTESDALPFKKTESDALESSSDIDTVNIPRSPIVEVVDQVEKFQLSEVSNACGNDAPEVTSTESDALEASSDTDTVNILRSPVVKVVEQEEKFQLSESSNACGNDASKATSTESDDCEASLDIHTVNVPGSPIVEVVEQEEKFQLAESSNACRNDAPKVTLTESDACEASSDIHTVNVPGSPVMEVVEQEEKFQLAESSNACGNDAPKVTSTESDAHEASSDIDTVDVPRSPVVEAVEQEANFQLSESSNATNNAPEVTSAEADAHEASSYDTVNLPRNPVVEGDMSSRVSESSEGSLGFKKVKKWRPIDRSLLGFK